MSEQPKLRITIEDLETGELEVEEMPKGEFLVMTTLPCYIAHTNSYPAKGTHVITVKGRTAK